VACAARRAVGLLVCPQCGAAGHEVGDTVSGAEGSQGQRHVPPPYNDAVPAPVAETAQQDSVTAPAAVEEPPVEASTP
jgi:hypothetical protein